MKAKRTEEELETLFMQASSLWEAGNLRAAFHLFKEAAERGHVHSQHNLAHFLERGDGVNRDVGLAAYWYKRAWRLSPQSSSCSNLARLYADTGNKRQALYWWNKAIAQDDGDAALECAKFLIAKRPPRWKQRAKTLLALARESSHISQEGRDEAVYMILNLIGDT